jgi:arylsulfatase A-like enzyme
MTRREWMLGAVSSMGAAETRRPNVLLVMTDQLSGLALSAAGNRWCHTPHLDSLAKTGRRLVNTWCTSPVCSPARSSLITGCLPHATGVEYNGQRMNPAIPTIGEMFRGAGYETAWVGKWHLPEGFPNLRVDGKKVRGPEEDRGFSFLPCELPQASMTALGDFSDAAVASTAAAFLRLRHDKPFLLAVSLLNPHDICGWVSNGLPENHPARRETAPAESELPPLPANFAQAAEPEFVTLCRERDHYGEENLFTKSWTQHEWRRYLWTYYRMIVRVDRSIGVVLDALRDANLEDDTVVVFTSDHGEGMAAHHWVVKLMLWQETLTVPLIFRWSKRIVARNDLNSLASVMDVTPTLCDLAGVPLPKPVHGSSLWPLLRSGDRAPRTSLFAQLAPDTQNHSLQGRAVRSSRYKYMAFSAGKSPELLFDLDRDPGETRNLAGRPEHRTELELQRKLLSEWVRNTGDRFETESPLGN